jgi:hypothetical protein
MDILRLSLGVYLVAFLAGSVLLAEGLAVSTAVAHDGPVDAEGCHEQDGVKHCH